MGAAGLGDGRTLFCCFSRLAAFLRAFLEFDAGIITAELERCGLCDLKMFWEDYLREGICTMDPDIGSWVREQNGITDYHGQPIVGPLGLRSAISLLVPDSNTLSHGHHAADVDAKMAWLVCRELVTRSGRAL